MERKIKWKDLNWDLKLATVVGWVYLFLFCVGLIIGLVEGVMSVV